MANLAGLLELDHILNRLPIVVFRLDRDGRHLYVNKQFCDNVGRSPAELLGRGPESLGFPAELVKQLRGAVQTVFETGQRLELEFEVRLPRGRQRVLSLLTPEYGPDGTVTSALGIATDITRLQTTESALDADGTLRNWLSVKFPVTDSTGRLPVGGVAVDLTDQLQFEQFRRETSKMLQAQKLESLGVLAGGIAHDFNNVLTGVLGNASLAREHLSNPAAVDECLRNIEQAALRAAELCQQMLAFAGRGQYSTQVTDLNLLASEMIHLLTAAISKKAVLRFNLGSSLPLVRCDATQVRQVIMNLVTNASDAIGDRSGVITVTTGLLDADRKYLTDLGDVAGDKLEPGRYLFLEVADTGCGMTEDVRTKIFDPFFTTKFVGRGLGLAAVQGIVRSHHGAIKVASKPGTGSAFTILLPTTSCA